MDAIFSEDPGRLQEAQRRFEEANRLVQVTSQAAEAGGDLIIEPSPEGIIEYLAEHIGQLIGERISRARCRRQK